MDIADDIYKHAADAIFVMDLNGKIKGCNDASEKIYGYLSSELTGQYFLMLLPQEKEKEFETCRDNILFGEITEPIETERIIRNKSLIKVSASYSPVKDASGKITGISSIERQVSAYRTVASRSQSLLETAPDAMVIVNSSGQIVLINAQTERLFHYKKEELLGQEIEILIPNRFLGKHTHHRNSFFSAPKTRSMGVGLELFGKKKDGSEFPVEISLSPLETAEGLFVSAAIRDITEKKLMEKQIREANINLEKKVQLRTSELERKNKELEQFAYVASHDLQEPLRTTSSLVELFKEKYHGKMDENADKMLTFMVQANDRMKVLIKDLLDYSRIGRKTELQEVNCSIMLNQVIADIDQLIKDTNAAIHVEKLPILNGYATELKLLFQNLISNSIKFRKKDITPVIKIAGEKKTNHWQFTVEDNGIGIDPKYYERVFVIFQRLHTRSEYEGSGIGLAHCKKIVELHGGKIWVEPAPGGGSIFHFTINEM